VARAFSRKLVLPTVALFLLSGCGDDDPPKNELTSAGKSQADRDSARTIVTYFKRNASQEAWFEKLRSIRVADGVATFETEIDAESAKDAAEAICDTLQGSDEVDFAKANAVLGSGDTRYSCPVRTE